MLLLSQAVSACASSAPSSTEGSIYNGLILKSRYADICVFHALSLTLSVFPLNHNIMTILFHPLNWLRQTYRLLLLPECQSAADGGEMSFWHSLRVIQAETPLPVPRIASLSPSPTMFMEHSGKGLKINIWLAAGVTKLVFRKLPLMYWMQKKTEIRVKHNSFGNAEHV